ncbi:MAG TPA: amidohydrolase family protein [Frankiaceae bacterium]|nr:amidohydrolase family protein [Frankiaceae bacterium]
MADVAVEDGQIVAVGGDIGAGHREVDADGMLVTPGWVDIHSHYDGQALWDPILETSAAHGVTTVVMGNCGVGFAPVRRDQQAWTIALMEGVEDIPASVLEEGLGWQWESFPQYLDALDAAPHVIDIAAQVPHAPLRVFAMGERGIDHAEQPTADEIALMGRVAAEAIEAGAVGFSTSRSQNHKASDGRITPSYSAGEAELLGIAEAIGRTGKGVFELNVENWDIDAELALMRRMCEVSGRPLSAALLQRSGQPAGNYRRVLDGLSKAAADGLDMWAQVAPRPTGLLMSLRGRVNPLAASPTYQELARQGMDGLPVRLADPENRSRILTELDAAADANVLTRMRVAFELEDPKRYDLSLDSTLEARAKASGVSVNELAYDVLAAERFIYVPVSNYGEGNLNAAREMLLHERTVPGLSDGGAHCTMVGDFDYPTFMLSYWGRDAGAGERLPVELVIKQQCADTAALLGFADRGILAAGKRADLNVIDLAALGSSYPSIRADLPSGGSRLVGHGLGYVATIVAGEAIYEGGQYTGATPGRLVRSTPA